MKYSTEWNGHKIEWEVYSPKKWAYLITRHRLFIDGIEHKDKSRQLRFSETFRTCFTHEGREVPAEIYERGGFYGVLTKIKVDGEWIAKKYISWLKIKNGVHSLISQILTGLLAFLITLNILLFAFFGIRPVLRVKKMPVENVAGVFFYADSLGNLMTYQPSNGSIDTIYSNDSMAVRDVSPDGKSVVLIHPKEFKKGENILRKFYWLTLDDNQIRLIGEWEQSHPYASFTPDGENIYLTYSDSIWSKGVIADTSGNVKIFDGSVFLFNSTVTQCFGRTHNSMPWKLFDIQTGEGTELDTILFPKDEYPRRWNDDTVVIKTYENLRPYLYFIDINTQMADTMRFGMSKYVNTFPHAFTVSYVQGTRLYPFDILYKTRVFDGDEELWSVMTYWDYPEKMYSDKTQILISSYNPSAIRVISSEGTTDPLPITGRILLWK